MRNEQKKETVGAWVIHHGRKVALDASGAAEFPAIDEAAKAASLLTKLSESKETTLSMEEVKAVAQSSGLNPRHELNGLLETLKAKRLIDRGKDEVAVLGLTPRGAVGHASSFFWDAEPSKFEVASINLAEISSAAPVLQSEAQEYVGDAYKMSSTDAADFITRAEQIGFVDAEGEGSDRLVFNGNLFRRDNIEKASKVLGSLSTVEQNKFSEFDQRLKAEGCVSASSAEAILGGSLFEKLKAAGVFDLNTVSNGQGEHVFVTAPGAFHKFVDPMVDDCFDMAKSLVSALKYGMTMRHSSQGRIYSIDLLLRKLLRGHSVGPATAIGHDYRVLEMNRVVKITPENGLYRLWLLKKEVGQMALQVLTTGDASAEALTSMPQAPMSDYIGPEASRMRVRKYQRKPSKRATQDILGAIRGHRTV